MRDALAKIRAEEQDKDRLAKIERAVFEKVPQKLRRSTRWMWGTE